MNAPDCATAGSRPRRIWKKLATLAVSLALSSIVLEIVVRATWTDLRYVPRSARVAPGVFTVRLKPDTEFDFELPDGGRFHVTTNARGFRGPLVGSISGKPLKIVSIGDSFTFGWGLGLEQLGPARFVAACREAHPGRDLGYANVATPGWGPRDYLFAFQTEVARVRPDLVVLGFFAENDVLAPELARIADAKDAPSIDTIPPGPPTSAWRSLDWARVQFSSSLPIARLKLWLGHGAKRYAIYEKDVAKQRVAWETTRFYLSALYAAVRANAGRLVIVSYPSELQVDAARWLDDGGYDSAMPDRMLESFCAERGVDFIPLLDRLREANANRDLYIPKDRHMSAKGHEVVARVLIERLGPIVDRTWDTKPR